MSNSYTLGTPVTTTATFKTAGALADPTTTTVTVRDGQGVKTNPTPTHDSLGVFHVDTATPVTGQYVVRFVGTGACAATSEQEFFVTTAV